MNMHDDAAFDHAFKHAQMMQNNSMALSGVITNAEKDEIDNALKLPKGDGKTEPRPLEDAAKESMRVEKFNQRCALAMIAFLAIAVLCIPSIIFFFSMGG